MPNKHLLSLHEELRFFIPGFALLSFLLAGWGASRQLFCDLSSSRPSSDGEDSALETRCLCSLPFRPRAGKQNLGNPVEICTWGSGS